MSKPVAIADLAPTMLTFAITFQVYIDIRNITQLQEIHHREDGLLLGASVTIADAITAFEESPPVGKLGGTRVRSPFAELAAHMRQVATPQVRHVASVAGEMSQDIFSLSGVFSGGSVVFCTILL